MRRWACRIRKPWWPPVGLSLTPTALTAGSLPPGLSLSSTGTISGTPTAVGASSFTVTVTDTETTPQTASLPLVLLVVYPTTATDSELIGPYAFLFQGYDDVLAGVLAYQTATIGSLTADGTGVISDGELDANHQSSNPSGNTISSQQFLGTYTLGTDNRGYMTITRLNADGTTGGSSTYAITAKAPVTPATVATQVDMIEFDDNGLQGTRGSGTMLAQQPVAFSAGLKGSYAFGLSGDTPCLPTCTVGDHRRPSRSRRPVHNGWNQPHHQRNKRREHRHNQLCRCPAQRQLWNRGRKWTSDLDHGYRRDTERNLSHRLRGLPGECEPGVHHVDRQALKLPAVGRHGPTADASQLQQRVDERSHHRLRECPVRSRTVGRDPGRCAQSQHGDYFPGYRQCGWTVRLHECGCRRPYRSGQSD